jgi:hypothetical protein
MEMMIVLDPGVNAAEVAASAGCCIGKPIAASGAFTDR